MKINEYCQWQRDSTGSVEFSNVQVVHRCAGPATSNLDFKVTSLFHVEYLRNDRHMVTVDD